MAASVSGSRGVDASPDAVADDVAQLKSPDMEEGSGKLGISEDYSSTMQVIMTLSEQILNTPDVCTLGATTVHCRS